VAKIKELPGLKIISGFKGKLDFYYWMGIPCVRMWPSKIGPNRSPSVMSTWAAFTYAARSWTDLPPDIQELYNFMASDTILTGRDLFARSYLSGAFAYPTGAP